jgi:FHS family Na+ dependent glucose MFS transporter 1
MTTAPDLSKPPVTNSHKLRRALVYFASYIVLGIAASVTGPTLPRLAEQTGSDLSEISILFVGGSLGFVLGALLGGWFYDRQKGHPVLAVTLTLVGGLYVIFPLAPSLWLLLILMVLIGTGLGILDVGGNTLLLWLFGRQVGPYMNALHLMFGVGALLSPLIVDRVVIGTGTIRWVYWLLPLLFIPIVVWLLRVPSPDRPSAQTKEGDAPKAPIRPYVALIAMMALFFFLHTGIEMGFGGWVFTYGMATGVGTETVVRVLNSVYWGGFTLGRIVSIPLALKLRPRTMLLLDLIGAGLSIGLMILLPDWPLAPWIGAAGLGFFIASLFPTSLTFAERQMPMTGQVTAFMLVGANLGSMVLPWVIGQLFETVGPRSLLWVFGGAAAAALAVLLVILGYLRSKTAD